MRQIPISGDTYDDVIKAFMAEVEAMGDEEYARIAYNVLYSKDPELRRTSRKFVFTIVTMDAGK